MAVMESAIILKAKKVLLNSLEKYNIKDNILIGFSGGQDSLALTLIANDLYKNISVVIVNHNILKNNPTEKVVQLAKKIGIKNIYVENVKVNSKSNMEKNARIKRYAAFEKVIKKTNASALLLAHTTDDQAETVLLNLIRGSGLNALKGMPEKRGKYIRPFLNLSSLNLSRAETLKVCQIYNVKPWNDPTNKLKNDSPLRIQIREKIIPQIEKVTNRNIRNNLFRTATDLTQLSNFIDTQAKKYKTLQVSKLKTLDKVIRLQILRNALLENGGNPSKILKKHLNEADKLITDFKEQKEIQIPGNIRVKRLNTGKIQIINDSK
jgi:tRNA(Ile)-lysidine synthase